MNKEVTHWPYITSCLRLWLLAILQVHLQLRHTTGMKTIQKSEHDIKEIMNKITTYLSQSH